MIFTLMLQTIINAPSDVVHWGGAGINFQCMNLQSRTLYYSDLILDKLV